MSVNRKARYGRPLSLFFVALLALGAVKLYLSTRKDGWEIALGVLLLVSGMLGLSAFRKWTAKTRSSLWTKLCLDFVILFLAFVHYDRKLRWRETLLACMCPSDILSSSCRAGNFIRYSCGGEQQYFGSLMLDMPRSPLFQDQCVCKMQPLFHMSTSFPISTLVDASFVLLSDKQQTLFYLSLAATALSVILTFSALFYLTLEEQAQEDYTISCYYPPNAVSPPREDHAGKPTLQKRHPTAKTLVV